MAMNLQEVVQVIEKIAPLELQEVWDNSGMQLTLNTGHVQRVLVCLEITGEVIDEAESKQAELIITHHPLIFSGLKSIDSNTLTGSYITRLINLGISVYSSHTPFDKVNGGNNDYIADLLGLRDTAGLLIDGEAESLGRVGQFLEVQTLAQVEQLVEEKLELYSVQVVGHPDTHIKTVGLCTGAGSDLLDAAVDNGCQLFITGDVKYHDAQKAKEVGLCIIDAGHYGTEKFFAENFASQLRDLVNHQVEVLASEIDIDPFD